MRIPFGAQSQWSPLDAVQLRKAAQTNRTFLELAAAQRFSFPWSSRGFAVLLFARNCRRERGRELELSSKQVPFHSDCVHSVRHALYQQGQPTIGLKLLQYQVENGWRMLVCCISISSLHDICLHIAHLVSGGFETIYACFLLFVCVAWLFIFVKHPPYLEIDVVWHSHRWSLWNQCRKTLRALRFRVGRLVVWRGRIYLDREAKISGSFRWGEIVETCRNGI